MRTLDIRLFGAIEIRHQGALLTDFRSRKALALLAYLICIDRPVTREYLAGLAWPEMAQSQSLGLLRRTLHDLTNKLPDCLVVDRRTVHFQPTPPVTIDVRTFAQLAAQPDPAAWAQAVDLYRAPLLEGVYLDEAPDLESWLLREQEQWQQQMIALLNRLITRHTATAAYQDALRYARRLVALEPWREETHYQVMLLLARTGQISAALAHYGVCRRALWKELAVEPGPSTQALYARLQAAAQRPLHNLPPAVTPLIGRNAEVAELLRLLAGPSRLLTISGVGGIGKTRLALAAARQVAADQKRLFLHGVVFVALAGVDTTAQMTMTIAQALGLTLQGNEPPAAQVLTHLCDKELLLLLDNVEQLLNAQTLALLVQVLEQAPEVKLLITSRTRVGLHTEQLYWLQGLSVPTVQEAFTLTPTAATAFSALHLWLATVRRHQPDYQLTAADLPALITIGQQVQGLPLALELAAAWHSDLSPAAIAAELADNLDLLTSNAPDLPQRQRSLRAVFQTSWRLLTPTEQRVFPRLAVFRGGFTAELALAVADAGPALLQALVDKSLVSRSATGRYQLHELIRQFAAEQLAATGQLHTSQCRHATALLAMIRQLDAPSRYLGARPGLAAISTEYENVHAALHWCFAQGEGFLGLELVAALRDFWYIVTNWQEGRRWQELALAVPVSENLRAARAVVLNEWGMLLHVMSETALAKVAYQESLSLFELLNDQPECAWSLFHLARPEYQQGDNAACDALLFRALAIFRQRGDERGIATVLQRLAHQMMDGAHDLIRAEQFAQESLAIARRLDARGTIAGSLILLSEIATRQHDLPQAESYLTESLALDKGRTGMRAWALGKLGRVLLLNGKPQAAERIFQEALQIRHESGSIIGVAWMLECLGEVAVATGAHEQAVPMFSIAHTLRTRHNSPLSPHERQIFEQLVQPAHAVLGEQRFTTAWRKGQRLAQEQSNFAALFGAMPAP
jgi:predicted ATPase/DNA-binding SARP family transcriptional activator